jgi:hypothetical protein
MKINGSVAVNANAESATPTSFLQSPASLEECNDPSDVLAFLCKKHNARVERVVADGNVTIRLKYKNGEVNVGTGATTKEAVSDLAVRVEGKTRSGGETR